MNISDLAGARQLMWRRVRLTSEFVIDISLREHDGFHFVSYRWHPYRPHSCEDGALAQKVAEAKAPFLRKAMQLGGLCVVGAS